MARKSITLIFFVFFCVAGFSQSFRPDQLSGLQLWLRADSNIVLNGSNVSEWNDCSGNGYNAVQTTSANQPLLTAALPEINNKPSVWFDGTNDILNGVTIPNIHNTSFTVFIVAKNDAIGQSRSMITIGTYTTGLTIGKQSSGNFVYYQKGTTLTSGNSQDCSTSGIPFRIFEATKNLNIIVKLFVNSAPRDSSTHNNIKGSFTNDNYKIGFDNATIQYWKGNIAEIIIYDNLLNSSDRAKVQQYLDVKYAATVSLGPDIMVPYGFCDTALNATSGFSSYLWSTGDTTQSINVNTSGIYWVEVRDGFGFARRDSISVSYPQAQLIANDTVICAGSSVTLYVPALNPADYSFLWSTAETDSMITVQNSGSYWAKVSDSAGCFLYSDTIHVDVDSFAFNASIGPDTAFCAGNMIMLYHDGFIVDSYLWSDASTDSSLTIMTSGNYWLEATDQYGCLLTDTVFVTVSGMVPNVAFIADTVCRGDSTQFMDLSSVALPDSISGWVWAFGDGDSSYIANPKHVYQNAGNYTAVLQVTTAGSCSNSITRTVVVLPNPTASFMTSSSCVNIPVAFLDMSAAPPGDSLASWWWDFGDSSNDSIQNAQHAYDTGGVYTVTFTVVTGKGCSAQFADTISIADSAPPVGPIPLIFPPDNYISPFSTLTFRWTADPDAVNYSLQLSDSTTFNSNVTSYSIAGADSCTAAISGTERFWRIIACNLCGDSTISATRKVSLFNQHYLTGMCLWLKADTAVNTSGQFVTQWSDCSGNGYHAGQPTPASQPLLTAALPEINNMPSLWFDGANDILNGVTIPDFQNTSFTVFIVAKNDAVGQSRSMITIGTYLTGLTIGKQSSGNYVYYQNGSTLTSGNAQDCSTSGIPFRIFEATKDLNVIVRLFVNAASRTTSVNSGITGSFTNDNYKIGYDNGTIQYWKGNIAEIIIYDELLSDSDRAKVEKYLDNKYAIPVDLGPDIVIPYGFCDTVLDAGPRFSAYLWSTGDTTQSITINQGGTYWVSCADIFGFPSSDTIVVFKPSLYAFDTTICVNTSVLLQTGLGQGYDFLWSDSSTGPDLLTAFPGHYWIAISDSLGCGVSDTFTVTVDSFALQAGLGPDRTACRGELLGLASGAQQAVTYHWSDNTGNALMLINDAPGTFAEYSVTVTDINGCEARDTIMIFIKGQAPAAAFASDTVCSGTPTSFFDLSAPVAPESITFWLWNFGDGDSSTLQNPVHAYGQSGLYQVSLMVITDSGCFNTINHTIPVWAYPDVSFAPANGCSGIPVQFADMSANALGTNVAWWWDFGLAGTGDTSSLQNPVFTYDTAGTYTVNLIVVSQGGCADTASSEISIRPSLTPDFVYSHNCFGETTNFQLTTIAPPYNPILKWHWDFGDGDTSDMVNPQHTFALPGNYTVTLNIFPLNGCSVSVQKQVVIYPRPHADFIVPGLCIGQPGQFTDASTVNGDSIIHWQWIFPGGVSSQVQNPFYTPGDTGELQVSLIINTQNGCSDTVTMPVTVHPLPEASFIINPEFGTAPLSVEFNHSGTGSTTWLWAFGDGNTSGDENPQHTYLTNGIYTVTLTAYNEYGCWDTATGQVYVMFMEADIAVDKVYAEKSGKQLIISADLTNLGMRPIARIFLSAQYNGSSMITETWEGTMQSGASFQYPFSARFEVPTDAALDYVCVRAAIDGYDPDAYPENNEACAIMNDIFLVSDPYPNPAGNEVSADIILPFDGKVEISLMDEMGRQLAGLYSGLLAKGIARLAFDVSGYADGVYAIRVVFNDKSEVRKFLILH